MKRMLVLPLVFATGLVLADTFQERWSRRVAQFERENATLPDATPTVVLLGSSSMHGWEQGKRMSFLPDGHRFLNRGIGGDGIGLSQTTGIKNRLRASVYEAGAPTHVFLLNGRNSIGRDGSRVARTAEVYREVLEAIQAELPQATVCVITCAPVNKSYKVMAPHVVAFNARLRAIAADLGCPVIDLHARLVGPDGQLMPLSLTSDGLHFKDAGYRILADEIARVLREHPTPNATPSRGMSGALPE